MITTLFNGVNIHTTAQGSIVQSAKVENKKEKSTLKGMVGGKTQVVGVWDHSEVNEFSVTGSGDLTLVTGVGVSSQLNLISGGITAIWTFSYEQKLAEPSQWTYSGENYPSATISG